MDINIKRFFKEYISTIRLGTLPENLTEWAFILVVLNGFFLMFKIDLKLTVVLVLVSTICAIKYSKIDRRSVNILWILYALLCIFTIFYNDYPRAIVYSALRYQFWGMIFFFLGSSVKFANHKLMENMRMPIFLACFIGFFLYFFNPSWYNSFRYANVTQYTAMDFLRFSSFWGYSYVIAYLSGIYSTYCIVKIIKGEHTNLTYFGYVVAIAAVVLSQQRAVMGFSALVFVFANIYLLFKSGSLRMKRWLVITDVLLIISAVGFIGFVTARLDDATIQYGIGHFESMVNSDELVSERLGMYTSWINKSFPIIGDGFGRYSHAAIEYGLPAITDCEYIKIIHETGIMGITLFSFIILLSLVNGLKDFRAYMFEILIVAMYCIAMIGADPISSDLMQPWFFWFCIGRLNNLLVKKYERRFSHHRKLQHA